MICSSVIPARNVATELLRPGPRGANCALMHATGARIELGRHPLFPARGVFLSTNSGSENVYLGSKINVESPLSFVESLYTK